MEMAIHGAPLETLKSADEYKQYCTDVWKTGMPRKRYDLLGLI